MVLTVSGQFLIISATFFLIARDLPGKLVASCTKALTFGKGLAIYKRSGDGHSLGLVFTKQLT